MKNSIAFAEPLWLAAGAIVVVLLVIFFIKIQKKRQQELARFASSHLLSRLCVNISARRRMIKKSLLLLAVFCCFVALARPQYGVKWIDVKRKGIDILFAIDTSKSMLAQDVRPNRLQRAKFGILDFVGKLEGDRVGLLPFAGSAFLLCPMTIDYNAFESSLQSVDTSIIPKGGTDIASVIQEAEKVLSNEANHKILVLITDGENLEGDVLTAAKHAAEQGVTIYPVGVGSHEGELIPLTQNGKTGFVKDVSGQFVTSKLDEESLAKIAELTKGLYVPLGTSSEGLETIYKEKLALIPKEELAEKRHKIPLERFEWPLALATLLLVIDFLLSGKKSTRGLALPFVKTAGRRNKKGVLALLCCCLVSLASTGKASIGEDAFQADDFITASKYYSEQLEKTPDNPVLHYNYGTAAYKNNLFEDAASSFSNALKSDDLVLQEQAYYNRGNALFQQGKESLQTDRQHSIELWEQAVDSYAAALQLNEQNKDAGFNHDFVKKQLEALKKQEEEQKQQQNQQDKDTKQDQQDNEKDKQKNEQQQEKQENEGQNKEQKEKQDSTAKDGGQQQQEDKGEDQEEKAGEEQQEQQSKKEEAGTKNEETGNATEQEEKRQAQADKQAQKRDQERRLNGKMTSVEAKQLLDSLKDNEKDLNFVPIGEKESGTDQQPTKDW